MSKPKREHPKQKAGLHPRNKHRERYDFGALTLTCPELGQFVKVNEYNDESIDFFNPDAVKTLNMALLKHFYGIEHWDIPSNYLCPPIPGRADYIHHLADLLPRQPNGSLATGNKIRCLDIGVGANCVYPIIGNREYGWLFVGSDIDKIAIQSANAIINSNPVLKGNIEIRLQNNPKQIFEGIIHTNEQFDLTICNPPFHTSMADAQLGTTRKLRNLTQQRVQKPVLNFGGQNNELWCEGGEEKFLRDMVYQSKQFPKSCLWFTSLVSKQSNLKNSYKALNEVDAFDVKTISMFQGNKQSRLIAWTFLNHDQQKEWQNGRFIANT